jgi:hypothetical protein
LIICVPATPVNKRVESKAKTKRAFLFTGYPCFNRGLRIVKAFLSRFLDQTRISISQFFLTVPISCLPVSVEYELKYNTYAF